MEFYTCQFCGMTSYNKKDVEMKYCGSCNRFYTGHLAFFDEFFEDSNNYAHIVDTNHIANMGLRIMDSDHNLIIPRSMTEMEDFIASNNQVIDFDTFIDIQISTVCLCYPHGPNNEYFETKIFTYSNSFLMDNSVRAGTASTIKICHKFTSRFVQRFIMKSCSWRRYKKKYQVSNYFNNAGRSYPWHIKKLEDLYHGSR